MPHEYRSINFQLDLANREISNIEKGLHIISIEMTINSQEVTRIIQRTSLYPLPSFPKSYFLNIAQFQNQEINIGTR